MATVVVDPPQPCRGHHEVDIDCIAIVNGSNFHENTTTNPDEIVIKLTPDLIESLFHHVLQESSRDIRPHLGDGCYVERRTVLQFVEIASIQICHDWINKPQLTHGHGER
jgi:hypothetical protein